VATWTGPLFSDPAFVGAARASPSWRMLINALVPQPIEGHLKRSWMCYIP
jgi:hypothetical protein